MNKHQTRDQDVPRDLGTSSDRAMYSPSEPRGRGESSERNQSRTGSDQTGDPNQTDGNENPDRSDSRNQQDNGTDSASTDAATGGRDAGRTQGGGSGGHSPSKDVEDSTDVRNHSDDRRT